jgi:hypothetical protein
MTLHKITHIEPHEDFSMLLLFNDGLSKTIDFKPFIGDCGISARLKDPSYFSKVKIYDNGRGIFLRHSLIAFLFSAMVSN